MQDSEAQPIDSGEERSLWSKPAPVTVISMVTVPTFVIGWIVTSAFAIRYGYWFGEWMASVSNEVWHLSMAVGIVAVVAACVRDFRRDLHA